VLKPNEFAIAQLLVLVEQAGPRVVAKSDGVPFAHEDFALQVAVRFGMRPPGVVCPSALFAVPFASDHVAVVQVADQPDASLGFRYLILARALYAALGDPFLIADRYQPDWSVRGSAAMLEWPREAPLSRKVEEIAVILQGDGPLLLGSTQAMIDGTRLIMVRPEPDTTTLRDLWQLLPSRSRAELWPATFAFSTMLGFHAAVLPVLPTKLPPGYLSEEQMRDYPKGRYELNLQIAAEDGNQTALDSLFARPSSQDMLRLALRMLAIALVGAVAMRLFF